MKTLRIAVTDVHPNGVFHPWILEMIRRRFHVEIDEREPDYVLFSVWGDRHLRYPHAVRIFYTGENVHADFNLCDWAFSFDRLELGDRHFRLPVFQAFPEFGELCRRRRSLRSGEPGPGRQTRFCNFLYSNPHPGPRDHIFDLLADIGRVDSPGLHRNNMTAPLPPPYRPDSYDTKVEWQRDYRFSIAFENSSTPGYTTEKLVHALAADTIPIYWGDPEVERDFNGRRFVNCHRFASLEEAAEEVRRLEASPDERARMLSEPFFPDDRVPPELTEQAFLDQIDRIFTPSPAESLRRSRQSWGRVYYRRRRAQAAAFRLSPHRLALSVLQRLRRVRKRWRTRRGA